VGCRRPDHQREPRQALIRFGQPSSASLALIDGSYAPSCFVPLAPYCGRYRRLGLVWLLHYGQCGSGRLQRPREQPERRLRNKHGPEWDQPAAGRVWRLHPAHAAHHRKQVSHTEPSPGLGVCGLPALHLPHMAGYLFRDQAPSGALLFWAGGLREMTGRADGPLARPLIKCVQSHILLRRERIAARVPCL
jgi:hypothetical protein